MPENAPRYSDVDSTLDSPALTPEQAKTKAELLELGMDVRDPSMFNTFFSVLPEGTTSLREYLDSVLPEGAIFVEYGGPGRGVRSSFTPGRISRSVGVTLDVPPGREIEGHTVIQGDITSPDTGKEVREVLGGARPHLVIQRMLRGLDVARFGEKEFLSLLDAWEEEAQILVLVQVPVEHNDAVKIWAEKLKSQKPEYEVVFFAGDDNRSYIMRHSALLVRKVGTKKPQ